MISPPTMKALGHHDGRERRCVLDGLAEQQPQHHRRHEGDEPSFVKRRARGPKDAAVSRSRCQYTR